MKNYLKNLWLALTGRNPYQLELDKARKEYKQTAKHVQDLEKLYEKVQKKMEEDDRQVRNYQHLTENLRQHLVDKDVLMDRVKRDYQKRLDEYNATIDNLRSELQEKQTEAAKQLAAEVERHEQEIRERDEKMAGLREDLDDTLERLQNANQALARDCMAQQMLDKTNNALADLYAAMNAGETERILAVTETLEWCNPLLRVAQQHIMVLRRKNELEERQYEKRFEVEGSYHR